MSTNPVKPATFVIVSSFFRSGPFAEWHGFEDDVDAQLFAAKTEGAELMRVWEYTWHPARTKEEAS